MCDKGSNTAGGSGVMRRCECVYECLLELLESAGNSNNICCHRNCVGPSGGSNCWRRRCDCECVYECLLQLLEEAGNGSCNPR